MNQDMSYEDLQSLAALGVSDEKLYELRRQMERADAIRGQQGPQGATAGGIYVAANPLQHLAHGINQYRAGKDYKTAKEAIPGTLDQIRRGRLDAMNTWLGAPGPMSADPRAQLLREQEWQTGQRGA